MLGIKDSYKLYKKTYKRKIDKKEYKKICEEFLKFIMVKVFEGNEVKLPERFGTLTVLGKKVKPKYNAETDSIEGLAPDWAKTYALWRSDPVAKEKKEKIFFINEHTQRIRYKFFWSKRYIFLNFKDYYSLRLSRTNKRHLAQLIKNGKEYYVTN